MGFKLKITKINTRLRSDLLWNFQMTIDKRMCKNVCLFFALGMKEQWTYENQSYYYFYSLLLIEMNFLLLVTNMTRKVMSCRKLQWHLKWQEETKKNELGRLYVFILSFHVVININTILSLVVLLETISTATKYVACKNIVKKTSTYCICTD